MFVFFNHFSGAIDRDHFQLGSLSHLLNAKAGGYQELPDWPETAPDPSVRNVEVKESVRAVGTVTYRDTRAPWALQGPQKAGGERSELLRQSSASEGARPCDQSLTSSVYSNITLTPSVTHPQLIDICSIHPPSPLCGVEKHSEKMEAVSWERFLFRPLCCTRFCCAAAPSLPSK